MGTTQFRGLSLVCLIGALGLGCATSAPPGPPTLEVQYEANTSNLKVTVYPGLTSGDTLHVRVRNGDTGILDCASMAGQMPRIEERRAPALDGEAFTGPAVDMAMFSPVYDPRWLEEAEPTPEMLAAVEAAVHTIDICVMRGNTVVRKAELDIRRALDRRGTGKFDGYGDANEVISSNTAYAEACVNNLGEIPFFEKIGDKDYTTYSCLDSVPIPTTVTGPDGQVTYPETKVDQCDHPQFIYSLCEPNAVTGRTNGPRVTSEVNEQGTHWVLLCRKSLKEEGIYNDIAMLGHNPYTGKTCFFQNALYRAKDGLHVPHPADDVESERSKQKGTSLWSGIQGGYGSGIECVECHDADPFIHTPWIDGAKDENGDPVIPMMGIDDGFVQGFNDAPYTLVDQKGQGWTMPKVLTSPEAAACTKCHRMGDGRWARSWLRRLEGTDDFWTRLLTETGLKFDEVFWMPPEMLHLDAESWPESDYGIALDFIQECKKSAESEARGDGPTDPRCKWTALPEAQLVEVGALPEIDLTGTELAREALKIFGANVSDPNDARCNGEDASCASRRCAECHSVSKGGLRHWQTLTKNAFNTCNLRKDPNDMTVEDAAESVQCLRASIDDPDAVFAADKLGVLTTGVRYGYFRKLFRKAFGEDEWLRQYIQFKGRVGMPKGTYSALSQQEYAVILKWFQSNMAGLDEVIEDIPAPSVCEPFFDSDALDDHIQEMGFEGWGAANQENGIRMFGCETGQGTRCFTNGFKDRAGDWGAGPGRLAELIQLQFRSSFWTRSSADGRFVGNGGGVAGGSTITDLRDNFDIKIKASYDPGFFPDNSGFIFQGGGTGICTQDVLERTPEVTFEEDGCMRGSNINLYQHVARGLNGGDYFIINSQFTSDSAKSARLENPVAHFNSSSTMKFSPMIFNGATYEQLRAIVVDSPFEGDSVLSPSGELVISRLAGGPNGSALGYVIRKVVATKSGDNYDIDIGQMLARICMPGTKANISFDERFFVTHTHEEDRSNVILVDLLTGQQHRVTEMPAGGRALFPHFRSDNWFYFLVRDEAQEYVVASDLALRLAAGGR